MNETAYIETSIFGYLTARSTKNLILAANIEVTKDWWDNCRGSLDLYASQIVLDEAALGDSEIAEQRIQMLQSITLLEPSELAQELVIQFLSKTNLPAKAANDAAHIAIATVHGMDYLLTWNCKHIANAHIQKKLTQICSEFGYELPTICTPYEMIG
ncbi:type II toxin-antitoxin system VapC family toxin [Brunnivagina elsteri]|uniref:DNA-binding protein n=1 Tax=Brunnivagina elsteri CCALA 953 TaxID=987040 RepID=A0A2A2TNN8_9CYAN|nr:type II toxin-antitoxin system VapC family toxin [Calothrix elsteri]PAX60063.1 DNA-binding protein [Calothrix elsteri CCALA 953]